MSGMNSKPVSSMLPDDVEEQLANAKNLIFSLGEEIKTKDAELTAKQNLVSDTDARLASLNGEISTIMSNIDSRNTELNERENKCNQRESALDVYANALKEKEEKITKYLAIFENMKSVISR